MKTQITSALAQEQSNIFVNSLSSIIKTQLLTKTVMYHASEWPWLWGGGSNRNRLPLLVHKIQMLLACNACS